MIDPTTPRDVPILFSAAMIRALLAGAKTETRRVLKPQPKPFMVKEGDTERECEVGLLHIQGDPRPRITLGRVVTPQEVRHVPGMLLWVREQWSPEYAFSGIKPRDIEPSTSRIWYWADGEPVSGDWAAPKPSIHMPRWASRLTLLVRDVRVERSQEITEDGATAEGITDGGCLSCGMSEPCGCDAPAPDRRDSFVRLWNHLLARDGYGWDVNPFVTVTRFDVIRANIDSPATTPRESPNAV